MARPPDRGRFEFTFTPKHGSWLNLVEGFFSKFAAAPSCATSRRIQTRTQGPHHGSHGSLQREPGRHTWSYKLKKAALI